jgi:iron(III) transport system substrate-binding protein
MSKRNILKCSLIFTLVLLSATLPAAARDKVVVYTGISEPDVNNRMNEEFLRQTGIEVEILVIPSQGAIASRVRAEKSQARADVLSALTVDLAQSLAKDGLLLSHKAKYDTPEFIQKGYSDPEGFWHGWYASTTAIFWNTARFKNDAALQGVKPPATWDDLLNPAFKGKVILPNPQTTSIGSTLIATQIFRSGEEKAWDYERKLHTNVAQYTAAPNLTVALLEQGEGAVGAFWLSEVLTSKIGRKQPLEVVVPPDNVVAVFTASIVKGGPNTEGAKKYIEFLQSKFAQEVNGKYAFRSPLNGEVAPPEGAPPISSVQSVKFDLDWTAQNLDRIRKQWARETGQ